MKKFLCGIMAVFIAVSMASCADEKDESSLTSGKQLVGDAGDDVNLKEEDMPYGSTVYELSESNDDHVKYITCFDRRYFGSSDENNPDYSEIYAIHDYIVALNENDHDAMKSLYYDGYIEAFCQNNNISDIDEYIDNVYNAAVSYLGEGFEINYIDISNCLDGDSNGGKSYTEIADGYLEKIDVLDKVTSKKVVEIGGYTCYSIEGSGAYQLTNHMEAIVLAVYEIDGQIYIV
ncbi:MAG: hypothetical protein K2J47_09655 [Ruminococcus sp.]|nr:hypothetical protein [Ruminococcus sp.]